MALVLQPVASVAGYNSFASVAEADDYFSKRLHASVWTGAITATKEAALAWATAQLNTLNWKGARTVGAQPLCFPRVGLSYTESTNFVSSGANEIYDVGMGYFALVTVTSTDAPLEIKQATAELAMWLIASDTTAPMGTEGFSEIKVDSINLKIAPKDRPSWFSDSVYVLCKKFLKNSNKYSVATARIG